MMIMKVLKDMTLNHKPIRAGEYVRTDNPEVFLRNGYARYLTPGESQAVLDDYVDLARTIFAEPPQPPGKRTGNANRRLSKQGTLWGEEG